MHDAVQGIKEVQRFLKVLNSVVQSTMSTCFQLSLGSQEPQDFCQGITDYEALIGPWCVGVLLSHVGLASLLSQTILYNRTFHKERLYIKLLVYGTILLETAQTVFFTSWTWNFLVSNALFFVMRQDLFLVPGTLNTRGGIWIVIMALSGIVPFPIQLFYAFRIVSVSKMQWPAWAITFVSITTLALSLTITVLSKRLELAQMQNDDFVSSAGLWQIIVGVWSVSSVLCNVLIMCYMWHALVKHFTRGYTWKTLELVTQIVNLTIETGFFTTIGSAVVLFLFYAESTSTFMTAWILLPKLYSNMLLLMLNSRIKLKAISDSSARNNNRSALPLSALHFRHLTGLVTDSVDNHQH